MSAWLKPLQELDSPFPLLLLLIGSLVLLAMLFLSVRRWRRAASRPAGTRHFLHIAQPFERGFDLLLDGRWSDARQVLVETVKADPDRVLEYLELGKLFRRHGDASRAARLFEHLLARPTLDRAMRATAQHELGLAYRALGLHEPAAQALEHVLNADPLHSEARRELRRTHEERGLWEKAVAVEQVRVKRGEATDYHTLAALRTQQGKLAGMRGEVRQSGAHLRAARGLDPQYTEATLSLGRLLLRQGKTRKALRLWEELAGTKPEFLYLAFRDMHAAFRRVHNEAKWEAFLRAFTDRHPDDPYGHLALAEWYESQDRPEEAIGRLCRVLEIDPVSQEAHFALLTRYRKQGVPTAVLDSYTLLAKASAGLNRRRFRCGACGHTAGEPFWKCPACHVWANPERLMPQPGITSLTAGNAAQKVEPTVAEASVSIAIARDTPAQNLHPV